MWGAAQPMSKENSASTDPKPATELVPERLKHPPASLHERLFSDPFLVEEESGPRLYQHSVLCQTSLPYRDPGEEIRLWQRKNGHVRIELAAGRAYDGTRDDFVDVGLPYGPKPRLVLYHLNAEALRTGSPTIELEDSLTAFVKRTLGLDTGGRNIRTVKDQLTRLSAADFRFGMQDSGGASVTVKGSIIDGFDLWLARDPRQRVLWPTTVQFSQRYFESLVQHAVPLAEASVAKLARSAMALDLYTWLAQRLHRVRKGRPALVPWTSLHDQFGQGYDRVRDFRRVFTRTLKVIKQDAYRHAKFDLDGRGVHLHHSPPPVPGRIPV